MQIDYYMQKVYKLSKTAYDIDEVPIGCIIVHNDKIIGSGYNRRNSDRNVLSHAEIIAINEACKNLSDWRLEDCTLFVSVEPCSMCAGAILQARVSRVVFGCRNAKAGCCGSILNLLNDERFNHQVEVIEGIMEDEFSSLMKEFFKKRRNKLKMGDFVMKKALTIAGSDCSGGAGIQADLKTFSANGVFGMSVIVSVVAENTSRVIDIQDITPDMIQKQIDAVFEDIEVDAVKIGMLSSKECMIAVAEKIREYKPENVVVDPVMYAKNGSALMAPDSIDTLIKEIIPIAHIITPNIPEAEKISGIKITNTEEMKEAAKIIHNMGTPNVLIKGGHSKGDALDILYNGSEFFEYTNARINTKNTHGTGCTLSSAIASNLALGFSMNEAVEKAKKYITVAIENSLEIGKGNGPTNHFYELYKHGLKQD